MPIHVRIKTFAEIRNYFASVTNINGVKKSCIVRGASVNYYIVL